jgi:hypothetical protein
MGRADFCRETRRGVRLRQGDDKKYRPVPRTRSYLLSGSIGNMHSICNSCAVMDCGVSTVVINETIRKTLAAFCERDMQYGTMSPWNRA